MSKLFFRYGAMNSGKSTAVLQVAHNYEERDQAVVLVKPGVDSKGGAAVVSRLGVQRRVDILLNDRSNLRAEVSDWQRHSMRPGASLSCVLIDEAQFLTPQQVDQAMEVAVFDGIPVIAYGIRTDFRSQSFPGSRRLLEIAHRLEEMKTICRCGQKAVFNARLTADGVVTDGQQVMIDGEEVTYEARCARCFLEAFRPLT